MFFPSVRIRKFTVCPVYLEMRGVTELVAKDEMLKLAFAGSASRMDHIKLDVCYVCGRCN